MTVLHPEYYKNDEFQIRSQKLQELRDLGVDPYPHKFTPDAKATELEKTYHELPVGSSDDAAEGITQSVTVAGRLVLFRAMGKNAFGQIQDSTGRIQVMFNRELTLVDGYIPTGEDPLTALKLIEKKIDLGDIIGLEGNLFRTQKGELTVYVKKCTILCKTLLPLADKHAGLADKETRYRKRWLDLISNKEVYDTFKIRSRLVREIRQYFYEHHFDEVENPVMERTYGGAEAKPFVTKLNALDQEMFMRISLEIPLKKLIVGGRGALFKIGLVFRNEEMTGINNQELPLLKLNAFIWTYTD